MSVELLLIDCGTVPYREAWELQRELAARRQAGELDDLLLLLEHPPVYTKGRRVTPEELPRGEAWYEAQGIEVLDTDRGGHVTYHGPGQLVVYPIVSLAPYGGDVHAYVRGLERVMIAALAAHGVRAGLVPGQTGVWVGGPEGEDGALTLAPGPDGELAMKIGAIGLHVSRGVTTHGFAVNVANDLRPFSWILACQIEGGRVTSLRRELGTEQSLDDFAASVVERYGEEFDRVPRPTTLARLGLDGAVARVKGAA